MSLLDTFVDGMKKVKSKWEDIGAIVIKLEASRDHDYENNPELNHTIDLVLALVSMLKPKDDIFGGLNLDE